MSRFWVIALEASTFVRGAGSGARLPNDAAPLSDPSSFVPGGALEVTAEQYREVTSKGYVFEDGGSYRWQVVGNALTELADDRPILQVDITDTEILISESLVGTLRVLNSNGTLRTGFNGTGKLFLRHDGNGRAYRVNFTNGERAFSRTFTVPGRYEVVSDGSYAIDDTNGVRFFDVVEDL